MADQSIDPTASERTHPYGTCDYCGAALKPPSPMARSVRRFCSNAHRAKWRRQKHDDLVQRVIDAAEELQAFVTGGSR